MESKIIHYDQFRCRSLYSLIFIIFTIFPCKISAQAFNGVSVVNSSSKIDLGYSHLFPSTTGITGSFIMNGEMHYVKSNPVIKFQLLRTLHKNNHVRYLIMESGPAFAYLYNRYLLSGDESLLNWNEYIKYEIDFWRHLKTFNDSLPGDEKIQVLAFDFDQTHAYETTVKMIFSGVSSNEPKLQSLINGLLAIANSQDKIENIEKGNKLISDLLSSKNRALFDQIGRDTLTLQMIAANHVPYISKTKRDKQTYANVRGFLKFFTAGNYFAEYGISHVNRSAHHLAYLLNSKTGSPVRSSVVCILPEYINCVRGSKAIPLNNGILSQGNIKLTGKEDLKSNATLVCLDKKEKAFNRLNAAGDYVLIIKNQ